MEWKNDFGERVIEKALQYANHEWYAADENMLHGMDNDGRFVDTPDTTWHGEQLDCGWWLPNRKNIGIPYGWGCASTLEEFDRGLLAGMYAGNVPEDKSRYPSRLCVGVDCSGLLTLCGELPKKIATRDIPGISEQIEALDEIRPGDIFALPGSHVMLFVEFADIAKNLVRIIDATRSTGKVSQREVSADELKARGYGIYRRRM